MSPLPDPRFRVAGGGTVRPFFLFQCLLLSSYDGVKPVSIIRWTSAPCTVLFSRHTDPPFFSSSSVLATRIHCDFVFLGFLVQIFKRYLEIEVKFGSNDWCRTLYMENCYAWTKFAELEYSIGESE